MGELSLSFPDWNRNPFSFHVLIFFISLLLLKFHFCVYGATIDRCDVAGGCDGISSNGRGCRAGCSRGWTFNQAASHRYPADWLHLGSQFTTWTQRLQSEHLPFPWPSAQARGDGLQVRWSPWRILRKCTAEMSGNAFINHHLYINLHLFSKKKWKLFCRCTIIACRERGTIFCAPISRHLIKRFSTANSQTKSIAIIRPSSTTGVN